MVAAEAPETWDSKIWSRFLAGLGVKNGRAGDTRSNLPDRLTAFFLTLLTHNCRRHLIYDIKCFILWRIALKIKMHFVIFLTEPSVDDIENFRKLDFQLNLREMKFIKTQPLQHRKHTSTFKNTVLCHVTPYGACKNRRFEETYRLHRQGERTRPARNNVAMTSNLRRHSS